MSSLLNKHGNIAEYLKSAKTGRGSLLTTQPFKGLNSVNLQFGYKTNLGGGGEGEGGNKSRQEGCKKQ